MAYHHGDLRTALLEAAVEVLRERGVQGLSLRECARRVGVSHAAPYRHFANKDALLAALQQEGFRRLTSRAEQAIVDADAPLARLDAYGVTYVLVALEQPELHRLMFASELQLPEDHDPSTDAGAFALLERCVTAVIDGDDPEAVRTAAFAYWALVHGISMLILDKRVPDDLIDTPAKVEALTRASFAQWRSGPG